MEAEGRAQIPSAERELSAEIPPLVKNPSGMKEIRHSQMNPKQCICHRQTYPKRLTEGNALNRDKATPEGFRTGLPQMRHSAHAYFELKAGLVSS